MNRKVVQVPMDGELLKALDTLSRKEGRFRAELIREACRRYLRHLEEEKWDQAYQEGYIRLPEEPALGQAQAELASQVLPREAW